MKNSKRKNIFILISLIVAFVFCLPFASGMIRVGADTTFHMNRIEALKESIQNGCLYPYIYLDQNYSYGYGTPSFYGQVFLYPFAILRIIGISPAWTWRILIFMIFFFSSISISYAYRSIFNDYSYIGSMLVSVLYLYNSFLLNRVYVRGAIGELLALIFIPLIIVSIHKYIKEDKNNYIELGVFFSCLLLSHNISFIIMALVFGITIIVNIKDIIQKKKLLCFFKAVALGLLLSAFFIIPMLEQLSNSIYFINGSFSNDAVPSGMNLSDYFSYIINDSGKGGNGIGVGIALLFIPLITFNIKEKSNIYLLITGYLLVLVSSCLFPWKYVQILGFIQFSSRLMTIGISYLALSAARGILSTNNIKKYISLALLVINLCLFAVGCVGIYKSWGAINDTTPRDYIKYGDYLYTDWYEFTYNVSETSGVEYLPQNNDIDYKNNVIEKNAYDDNNHLYPIFYIDKFDYGYIIEPNNSASITFPKIYYTGYVVEVYDVDNYLTTLRTFPDNTRQALVSINVPAEYQNKELRYLLRYVGTKRQKISMGISTLTLLFVVIATVKKRVKNRII